MAKERVVIQAIINPEQNSIVLERTQLYCPECGLQGLYAEQARVDMHIGERFICPACSIECYIPGCITTAESLYMASTIRELFRDTEELLC